MVTLGAITLYNSISSNIAELRAEIGLTQEGFAERAGISAKHLQSVERGKENLTIKSLAKFAMLLGVKPATLFNKPKTLVVPAGRPRKKRPRPRRALR